MTNKTRGRMTGVTAALLGTVLVGSGAIMHSEALYAANSSLPPLPPPAVAPTVESSYVIGTGKSANSVAVSKRGGKKQREFNVVRNRGSGSVELDLDENGPGAERKGRKFRYEEGKALTVTLGTQRLDITFVKGGVQVGTAAACAGDDIDCIAKAVRANLSRVTPEEAAAALAALRQDLHGMKHGKTIEDVLSALALQ